LRFVKRGWVKSSTFDGFFTENPAVTQADVAEALGIGQGHLSQIINGRRMPRPTLAVKIFDLIGVPVETLARARSEGAA
jgi:transcriptional regulator with XRE-family HTH domain